MRAEGQQIKELEKITKYQELNTEVERFQHKRAEVAPGAVGTLGTRLEHPGWHLENLCIDKTAPCPLPGATTPV